MDEMLRGIKFEIMTENIFFQRLASYVTRGVLYSLLLTSLLLEREDDDCL